MGDSRHPNANRVSVLNSENPFSPQFPRIEIVVQRRPKTTKVKRASGRWGETEKYHRAAGQQSRKCSLKRSVVMGYNYRCCRCRRPQRTTLSGGHTRRERSRPPRFGSCREHTVLDSRRPPRVLRQALLPRMGLPEPES